jgi:hypothetical protein
MIINNIEKFHGGNNSSILFHHTESQHQALICLVQFKLALRNRLEMSELRTSSTADLNVNIENGQKALFYSKGSCVDASPVAISVNTTTTVELSDGDSISSHSKTKKDITLNASSVDSSSDSDNEEKNSIVEVPCRPRRPQSLGVSRKNVSKEITLSPQTNKKTKKKIRVIVKRLDFNSNDNESVVSDLSEAEIEFKKMKTKKSGEPIQSEIDTDEDDGGHGNRRKCEKKLSTEDKKASEEISRWLEKLGKIGAGQVTRTPSGKGLIFQKSSLSNRSLLGEQDDNEESSSNEDCDFSIEINSNRSQGSDFFLNSETLSTDGRGIGTTDDNRRTFVEAIETTKPSILRSGRLQSTTTTTGSRVFPDGSNTNRNLSASDHNSNSSSSHAGDSSSGSVRRPTNLRRSKSSYSKPVVTSQIVASVLAEAPDSFFVTKPYSERNDVSATDDRFLIRKSTIQRSRSERSHRLRSLSDVESSPGKTGNAKANYLPLTLNEPKQERRPSKHGDAAIVVSPSCDIHIQSKLNFREDAMDDVQTAPKFRRSSRKLLTSDDTDCSPYNQSAAPNAIDVGKYFTQAIIPASTDVIEQNTSKKAEIIPLKLKGALSTPRSRSRSRSSSKPRSRSKSKSSHPSHTE